MKTWEQYNQTLRNLSEKKVDQDSDGDNDFRDIRIARMIASGVPKEVAIRQTEGKPYDKKGSKKKIKEELSEAKSKRDLAKEIVKDLQTGTTAEERAKVKAAEKEAKEARKTAKAARDQERLDLAKERLKFQQRKQDEEKKERDLKRAERAEKRESDKGRAEERRKERENKAKESAEKARRKAIEKTEKEKTERLEKKVEDKSSAVKDRMRKAKSAMPSDLEKISDTESDASAAGKMGANIAKTGVGVAKATYQLGRAAYEKSRERKYKKELGKDQIKRGEEPSGGTISQRVGYKLKQKKSATKRRLRGAALAGARRIGYTEEFLYEVEKNDTKDKKQKVVDVMKGKNQVEINPNIKEASFSIDPKKLRDQQRQQKIVDRARDTVDPKTAEVAKKKVRPSAAVDIPRFKKEETVMVQDANGNDYVEFIDIVKPEPLKTKLNNEEACPICNEDPCQCLEGTIQEVKHTPTKSDLESNIGGGNLKKLTKKAVKRIDYDVDGDVDPQDKVEKSKGEYGEELPTPFGKFRTGASKTKKEEFSNWRSEIEEGAAWTKKSGKNPEGGLNEKGRKSYERENPGSDLKAPSKKVGNKRRASFCARMKGMKKKLTSAKTANDPDSRINKSLRAWNC